MTILTIQKKCPECRSLIINDIQNGEMVCSTCGVVIIDQVTDYGPELKTMSMEEKMHNSRASGHTTYSQHDLGISTEISLSTKDFSGKQIDSGIINQMNNLRKWQQRVRILTSKERRLANVLSKIGDICQSMALPKNILETAAKIYRNIDNKIDVKGKSIVSISIAIIYMACKQCNIVRSFDEICKNSNFKDVRSKTKLAARYYRTMMMEYGIPITSIVTMDKYISKIANITQTDTRVERLALEIAEKTKDHRMIEGKSPNGIAAAYLYISSVILGRNVLQRDVSSIAGITEVTIRNRCKEILTNYKIKFIIKSQN